MFEPYRSFHLLQAAALGEVLVITFRWDDGADDGTVYLIPLDTSFLAHHLELTLGGPRESWEAARTTPLGPRFTVVRPYGQD